MNICFQDLDGAVLAFGSSCMLDCGTCRDEVRCCRRKNRKAPLKGVTVVEDDLFADGVEIYQTTLDPVSPCSGGCAAPFHDAKHEPTEIKEKLTTNGTIPHDDSNATHSKNIKEFKGSVKTASFDHRKNILTGQPGLVNKPFPSRSETTLSRSYSSGRVDLPLWRPSPETARHMQTSNVEINSDLERLSRNLLEIRGEKSPRKESLGKDASLSSKASQ